VKILVLGGCGAMGSEATRDLATTARDCREIVVADIDRKRAEAFAASLEDPRVTARACDLGDAAALQRLIGEHDLVANCTPYTFGLEATRAAIAARRPYLDLGGLYNTPRQLALDAEAKEAGVTILLGCGATPGVTNLIARHAASRMDSPRAVHIAFASFRHLAPSPGLLDTILDEFSPATARFYFQDGAFVPVGPLSGATEVEFADPVGRQVVYFVPHSETHTLPRFLPGVTRVDVRGTWRPEIMRALSLFVEQGLLDPEPIAVGDACVSPKQFLRAHLLARPPPAEPGVWAFYLAVEVEGEHGGRRVRRLYRTSHPGMDRWGTGATARMTGIPASIGAQLLARGRAKARGVVAPEACFDPEEFFRELEARGIRVHETVIEEGTV
jgi:saccharopine dehydrogenase (NAD+, L-lysine-forming)